MRAAGGRRLFGTGLAAAAALTTAAQGLAADFGGSVAFVSDYVYHGLARTCGAPAAQGDLHVDFAGPPAQTFAGVWGSAGIGNSYCRKGREIDLYLGERLTLGADESLTFNYVHYAYPGGIYLYGRLEGHRLDYDEIGGTWAFEDRLYLTLAWTPNAIEYRSYEVVRDRTALSFGVQLHQPVGEWLTLSAGAGYDEVTDVTGAGYAFWNAGLGRAVGPVQLEVSYFRTASRAERLFGPQLAGGRVAATAVWRF